PWAGTSDLADRLPDDPRETVEIAAAWSERLGALDWERLGESLIREGYVLLPALLPATDCAALRVLFNADDLFVKTVEMDDPDFGKGVYRYFRAPVPAAVAGLRRAVYPYLATVANVLHPFLGEDVNSPPTSL